MLTLQKSQMSISMLSGDNEMCYSYFCSPQVSFLSKLPNTLNNFSSIFQTHFVMFIRETKHIRTTCSKTCKLQLSRFSNQSLEWFEVGNWARSVPLKRQKEGYKGDPTLPSTYACIFMRVQGLTHDEVTAPNSGAADFSQELPLSCPKVQKLVPTCSPIRKDCEPG